jgi:hypothetical protein
MSFKPDSMEDLCTKLTLMFDDQLTYEEYMEFTTEELTGFDGRIEQIENNGPYGSTFRHKIVMIM